QKYFLKYQQEDGNLVLYMERSGCAPVALWSSTTQNSTLGYVEMRIDGNLMLVDGTGQMRWQSDSGGHYGAYLLVQNDGNLVIRDPDDSPAWDTHSNQLPAA